MVAANSPLIPRTVLRSATIKPVRYSAEMAPLALVGEDLTVIGHRVLHDLRELDNPWHEQMLHHPCAPDQNWMESDPSCLLLQTSLVKLQNSS